MRELSRPIEKGEQVCVHPMEDTVVIIIKDRCLLEFDRLNADQEQTAGK